MQEGDDINYQSLCQIMHNVTQMWKFHITGWNSTAYRKLWVQ